MAVTLPLVLLILDWYPYGRIESSKKLYPLFIEKIPFFALSILASVITITAQSSGKALVPFEAQPLGAREIVASKSITSYLQKMFWPADLSPFYPYPEDVSFFAPEYFLPALFVIVVTGTALRAARKHKFLLAVRSYYLITLLPVMGIIQVGGQSMARGKLTSAL